MEQQAQSSPSVFLKLHDLKKEFDYFVSLSPNQFLN